MRVLAAIALVLALAQAAPAAVQQAHLAIVDRSPATAIGTGFQPRERVRVALYLDAETRSKAVTATATGRFRVTFHAVSLGACDIYTVTATGDRGSRARLRIIPACAAP